MKRREFLASAAIAISGLSCAGLQRKYKRKAMTVNGKVDSSALGKTLPHEHILVDFVGWEKATKNRYDEEHAFQSVLPRLLEIKKLGCDTFVDCTPAYLGRDPILLKRLSDASGLHIITNTGIYAARDYQHVPDFARTESDRQIAQIWIGEFFNGIDGTDIHPGFIKSGVNSNQLGRLEVKLIRAACITNHESGLPFAIHTGTGTIHEQIKIIEEENTPLSSFIWTHCQNEGNVNLFAEAAQKGVWLSLDGLNLRSAEQYLQWLQELKQKRLLHKVLLSQDSGWYDPAKPGGGVINSYAYLFSHFIPLMRENDFSDEEIELITGKNPQTAFSLRS